MRWRPLGRFVALVLTASLLAAACTADQAEPTQLAMVDQQPTVAPTPVATTAPIDLPTSTPIPTSTALPTSTAVPATATAVPPTAVPPTAVPATAVPPAATATPEPTVPPTAVPEPTATPKPTVEPTSEATADPEPTVEATPAPAGEGGPPASHVVTNVGTVTFGQAGLARIFIPAIQVELVGFHEASHPGAQAINASASGLNIMVLESRGRGTPSRSAADIVVPPGEPIYAPVTGTVVSATQYVLYCKHQDKLVYIEPDGLPGWQVRLFHVTGDIPAVGARVIAGETIIATGGANKLPFESQIDEFTAEPSWPHTHLEVVDTNVPDDRPPGGGC